MLQGYTVPLSPRGIANLATEPPWHYAGVVVGAEFWTDPATAAATLPDGLTPDPQTAGHGTVLFIDWQYSGSRDDYLDPVRSQYHEFFVLLDARWQDNPVAWCPYIYVDNDQALARGWIQGFPKKLGTVAQTRTFTVANQAAPVLGPGGRLAATVSAAGYRLANALITPLIDYRLHNPAFAWHLIISLRDPAHPGLQSFRVHQDLTDLGISDQDARQGSELAYPGPEGQPLSLVAHGAHRPVCQLASTLRPADAPKAALAPAGRRRRPGDLSASRLPAVAATSGEW